jgi:hypothetical protein
MENIRYGLAYGCPYLQRNDDCSLKEIDHFLYYEKGIWIERRRKKEKETILEHHKACSKNR